MNLFIKIILALLTLFIPFAFAGAEPWGFSVLQAGIIGCSVWWLLAAKEKICLSRLAKPILCGLVFLIVLGIVQSCFPQTLLDQRVSYPVSLMPLYTWENISLLATYGALFLLTCQIFPSQEEIKPATGWIVFCAVIVALCAVSFTKGEYLHFFAGVRGGVGPFLNRNHAALFFAMGAMGALGRVFFNYTRPDKQHLHREQRRRFYVEQTCGWIISIGLCAAVIFTRSRGGMLALLIGLFLFAFSAAACLPKTRLQKAERLFAVAVVLGGTVYWINTHLDWINEFAQRSQHISNAIRLMLYHAGADLLSDFPVWGIGLGAMPVAIPPYFAYSLPQYVEHLHNDWLELAIGIGYAGVAILAVFVLWFAVLVLMRMKHLPRHKWAFFTASCCALVVMSAGSVVDFHFFIPANAFLFFIFLGFVCAPTYDKHHLSGWSLPFTLRVLIAGILLCTLYIPLQKTVAWRCALFGKGLKQEAKLLQYQNALQHFPSPRFAVKLGNAYFNASLHAKTPEEAQVLRRQGFEIAHTYLKRYPKEPDLSKLYVRTRPKK